MEETAHQDLRVVAHRAIEAGRVPARRPESTWGGAGCGARCAVCALPVAVDQLGFEVDFAVPGQPLPLGPYHMHVRCYHVWESIVGNLEIAATIKGLKLPNGDGRIGADEWGIEQSQGKG